MLCDLETVKGDVLIRPNLCRTVWLRPRLLVLCDGRPLAETPLTNQMFGKKGPRGQTGIINYRFGVAVGPRF